MRLYFWKHPNKNRERPQLVRCHVHSRFFYFVKSLNLPALIYKSTIFIFEQQTNLCCNDDCFIPL